MEAPKRYHLYACYYELWISPKKLDAPLLLISSYRSLEAARSAAERYDNWAHVIFDSDLTDEVEPFEESTDMIEYAA